MDLFSTFKDVAVDERPKGLALTNNSVRAAAGSGNLFQPTVLCLTRVAEIAADSESNEQAIGRFIDTHGANGIGPWDIATTQPKYCCASTPTRSEKDMINDNVIDPVATRCDDISECSIRRRGD